MKNKSRRNFIKKMLAGSLVPTLNGLFKTYGQGKVPNRTKKGDLYYRRLGRTNLQISEISLGGSPLPDWAILMQAVERGVNYIDTSHNYSNGNSERQIGRVFKEVGRDKVHVSTKFHLRGNWSTQSIIDTVEGSLLRLGTDYIDVSQIHGASSPEQLTDEKVLLAFNKLKQDGKIRFNGFSCHSNHLEIVKTAVECGSYDVITVGYNIFDIKRGEEPIQTYDDYLEACGIRPLLRQAHAKDIGVIAMKTLKIGGRRQNLDKYRTADFSLFQSMLKWVLENPAISAVITEMMTYEQLDEDLAVSGKVLTSQERKNLYGYVAENSKNYCHLCGICEKNCPAGIPLTSILRYLAYYENYDKKIRAKSAYASLPRANTVKACRECGNCVDACPNGVNTKEQIKKADVLLGLPA